MPKCIKNTQYCKRVFFKRILHFYNRAKRPRRKNIEESINKDIELKVKNTICNATSVRQKETQEIAKQVDLMIIIGGKHSSNTNKLYQIAKKECNKCLLIETAEELDKDYIIKSEKIGIMAGASTPKESIESTVEKIKKMC